MTDLINRIGSLGYTLTPTDKPWYTWKRWPCLVLTRPTGEQSILTHPARQPVTIGCGACGTIEAARELAAKGIGIVTTIESIYRSYYAPEADDDEWAFLMQPLDRISYDLIRDELDRLGVSRVDDYYDEHGAEFLEDTKHSTYVDYGGRPRQAEVGRLSTGEWCLEWVTFVGIDDYALARAYYRDEPSRDDIDGTVRILDIESHLLDPKNRNPIIECRRCGRKAHWTDCGKNLSDAWYNYCNSLCGCLSPASNSDEDDEI